MATREIRNAIAELRRLDEAVKLILNYQGPLPTDSSTYALQAKNTLRATFHHQLAGFCVSESRFMGLLEAADLPEAVLRGERLEYNTVHPGGHFYVTRGGRQWAPLITQSQHRFAEVHAVLQRRRKWGHVFTPGGDLDNQLKVVLDGLRIPQEDNETRGFPLPEDRRYFCLLENDALITDVRVQTAQLYAPKAADEQKSDVILSLYVTIVFERW